MSSIKNILEGWKNVVWKNPKVEEVAKNRLEICGTCELNVDGVCSKKKEIQYKGELRRGCGCPLRAKLRSMDEECPLGKWGPHDTP